jgi:NTE family protein
MKTKGFSSAILAVMVLAAASCAHYPVNQPLAKYDPDYGYRGKNREQRLDNSEQLLFLLSFSGGGTRAAAFSYGVLEELKETSILLEGKRRRLLDEVDAISGVSGGSFTAAYYGLFGDRIFQDFETKFLKKNVQGALEARMFLNPYNWLRLFSPTFDRSDLAAEYYDTHIFEGKTFGDMAARKGPMILLNATDMVTGIRLAFSQDSFDIFCSDLSSFPVARAVAASSAVPILLTPITLKNYSNSCGFALPEQLQKVLREHDITSRSFSYVNNLTPYLDADRPKYIHVLDGGVSDNLGLRAALDRVIAFGNAWDTLRYTGRKDVHKIVFLVVNAETELSRKSTLFDKPPAFSAMLNSYSSVAITRYNFETIMLLRESFPRWTEEIRKGRCGDGPISTEPGACGDIQFYFVEVDFKALKDKTEQSYFKQLPTSFKLSSEEVDKLRAAARRILVQSPEYKKFLSDLR